MAVSIDRWCKDRGCEGESHTFPQRDKAAPPKFRCSTVRGDVEAQIFLVGHVGKSRFRREARAGLVSSGERNLADRATLVLGAIAEVLERLVKFVYTPPPIRRCGRSPWRPSADQDALANLAASLNRE